MSNRIWSVLALAAFAAGGTGCHHLGGEFYPEAGPLSPLFHVLHAHRYDCGEWGCCPVGFSDSLHGCDPCDGAGHWVGCGGSDSCGGGHVGAAACTDCYSSTSAPVAGAMVAAPRAGSSRGSAVAAATPRVKIQRAPGDAITGPNGQPRYVLRPPEPQGVRPAAHDQETIALKPIKLRY